MTYIERFDGQAWWLADTYGRALFLHIDCGSTVWGDPLDAAWRYGGTGRPECPTCGVDVRSEHWARLFVGEPVTVTRPDPGAGQCGATTVFWLDQEACDAKCVLPRGHEPTDRHKDEDLGEWSERDLMTMPGPDTEEEQ